MQSTLYFLAIDVVKSIKLRCPNLMQIQHSHPNCVGLKWDDFEGSEQHSKRFSSILCWKLKDSPDETEIGSKLTTRHYTISTSLSQLTMKLNHQLNLPSSRKKKRGGIFELS